MNSLLASMWMMTKEDEDSSSSIGSDTEIEKVDDTVGLGYDN